MLSHSVVSNSVTSQTVALQALLSMEFSRQDDRSGLLFFLHGSVRRVFGSLSFYQHPS